MSEVKTVSVAQYAEMRGVTEQAIRNAIDQGLIVMPTSGRIDVDQADASWGRQRRARMTQQGDDQGRRSAEAKIVAAVAKLRLAKNRLDESRKRYLDRAVFTAQSDRDVAALFTALHHIPAEHAARLAARLDIEEARARELLERFMALAIGELGDLGASGEPVTTVKEAA